jgi:hypothetical protein
MAKVGRPSKYTSGVIEEVNKYLEFAIPENQEIPTVEGIALKLGISKQALYRWAKKHKEFRNALRKIKLKQKESLIKIGVFGGKEINASIVALLLKVNHKMVETTKTDLTSDGKPVPILGYVHRNDGDKEAGEADKEN